MKSYLKPIVSPNHRTSKSQGSEGVSFAGPDNDFFFRTEATDGHLLSSVSAYVPLKPRKVFCS